LRQKESSDVFIATAAGTPGHSSQAIPFCGFAHQPTTILIMDLRQFIAELKGRGVYRVTAIYCAGAWALLQVADVMFPVLGLPEWSISAVLIASAAGFPVSLALAWLFDLTPRGVVEAEPVQADGPRIKWSKTRILELTVLLGLAMLVGYLYYDRLTGQEDTGTRSVMDHTSGRTSIAVMPFVNMSGVQEMEYLGDGLAEEILNLLAKLNELDVAARTSSFYFKNKNMDIKEIGSSLGVGHVLEGSVRHQSGKVRVTVQLIDSISGFHLWSETYDRNASDLLALQDEIAGRVVDSLQVLLSTESRDTLSIRESMDPVAYDYYLRGLSYLRLPNDESNFAAAVALFGKAVALNPEFADAYAGLCDAHLGAYAILLDIRQFEAAESACHRALTLDQRAASVYVALGNLYRTSGQYAESIEEFHTALAISPASPDAYLGLADTYFVDNELELAAQNYGRALELQPNYWQALMSMANFQFNSGQVEKAIPYYERIVELMPDSAAALSNLGSANFVLGNFDQATLAWQRSLAEDPSAATYANLASGLYFQGKFDQAIPLYHQAVELAPENFENWGNLGDAYRHSSQGAELAEPMYRNAIKLAEKRLIVNPSDAESLAIIAHYSASIGLHEQALDLLERAHLSTSEDLTVHYSAATALAVLGENERALDRLDKALQLGYPLHMAIADPNLQAIKNMPRFEALTARN
jgi:TolB-like protein/Tfp pilus assembly protein PilF